MEITNELIYQAKNDVDLQGKIIESFKPLVVSLALKFIQHSKRLELDDFISIGYGGVLKAIQLFDYSHNTQFTTLLFHVVKNEMQHEMVKEYAQKRCGVNVSIDKEINEDSGIYIQLEDLSVSMDKNIFKHELWNTVKNQLTQLEFDVVYKYYCEDKNFRQIGEEYDCTRQYIDLVQKRALRKLKASNDMRLFA